MITSITPNALKEKSFQKLIKEYLISNNGYAESFNSGYDKVNAIDVDCLFSFFESTQAKQLDKLENIYKTNYKNKVVGNLVKELRGRGAIDVLKHGIKDLRLLHN